MDELYKIFPRKTWIILICLLLPLLLIPLGIFLYIQSQNNLSTIDTWITPEEAVKKGINDEPYKILEIALRYEEDANPQISLISLLKKNGYAPRPDEADTEYALILTDKNNTAIQRVGFTPPKTVADPPPLADDNTAKSVVTFKNVEFVITVPWNDAITGLSITDNSGKTILSIPISEVTEINNEANYQTIPGKGYEPGNDSPQSVLNATNQKLDIAFIGESYTNMTTFRSDANRFKNFFLTHEPFKSRSSQIVFHSVDNTSGLQCTRDAEITRLITCNDSLVKSKVNSSGAPYDQIVVIVNTPTYGGSGGNDVSVAHRGEGSEFVMVHEFGHSFGNLADEYTLYQQNGIVDNKTKGLGTGEGNCYAGNPPASTWSGIVKSTDYALGCSYTNWYRSAQSSIMYTTAGTFNAVSIRLLNKEMDLHTNSTGTPTKRPTQSPIVTNKPTPTRKPTPTPGGNPADLVVSDLKLTDEAGNVKTNFSVNEKIYILVTHHNQGGSKAISATGITHSRFYSDRASTAPLNTDSDVKITMRNGEYGTGSIKSYGSSPSGPNSGFFNSSRFFTKSTPGTYTARHYINFNRDVFEKNYNNNQRTIIYTVGNVTSPTSPNPRLSFGPTRAITGVVPTLRPSQPPIQTPQNTILNVNISFPWLNNLGDRPVYTYRMVTLEIINNNGSVISTNKGLAFFDGKDQLYKGLIDVGTKLPTGDYKVKVKAEDTLKKQTSTLSIAQGQTTILPLIELVSGDLNGDNLINADDQEKFQDFTPRESAISLGCFGSKSCSLNDLDDNGIFDKKDLDLLLRGIKTGKGD